MKRTGIAIATLLSLSSAAFAQVGTTPARVSHHHIRRAADRSMSLFPADRYVRDANNCAGETARAVWSRHNALLGYACYSDPN